MFSKHRVGSISEITNMSKVVSAGLLAIDITCILIVKKHISTVKFNKIKWFLCLTKMCEQAAEAHKSKGGGHLSRRTRMSSDSNQLNKSSVDAILSSSDTLSASQVLNSLGFLSFSFLFWYPFVRDTFVHSCLSIFPGDSDC